MKRFFLLLLGIIFIFSGCAPNAKKNTSDIFKTSSDLSSKTSEINADKLLKGVWISYLELSMTAYSGGNRNVFIEKISNMLDNIKSLGLNTIFVHVRPFADAFYESKLSPWSEYLTGVQGKSPGYDPLKIIIEEAKKRQIAVHAWINPFRVSKAGELEKLSDDNTAKKILTDKTKANDNQVLILKEGIYFNPSFPEVHAIILNAIREIINKYDVDGIHIDDYFYPPANDYFDKQQYDSYLKSGGALSLESWRRENISSFLCGMYSAVKSCDKSIIVSVSPMADIEKDYNVHFADIKRWATTPGYTDIIIPQVYYGFENETMPFKKVSAEWAELTSDSKVKLCYGLAVYKRGIVDKYAGSGRDEWIKDADIIEKQLNFINSLNKNDGYVYFSYSYLFD